MSQRDTVTATVLFSFPSAFEAANLTSILRRRRRIRKRLPHLPHWYLQSQRRYGVHTLSAESVPAAQRTRSMPNVCLSLHDSRNSILQLRGRVHLSAISLHGRLASLHRIHFLDRNTADQQREER